MKKTTSKYSHFSLKTTLWVLSISIFIIAFFSSCAREESIPVKADFSIKVTNEDYSVPVKVEISNTSSGADTFHWSFEGASVSSSTERNPKPIVYPTAGTYKIVLTASNKDGNTDIKTIEIKVDEAMKVDFSWEMIGSDIAPVTLQMKDLSLGATSYSWTFDGGMPAHSTEKNPKVVFHSQGEHTIKLTIHNGRETYSVEKKIMVKPAMAVDFDWSVDFIDEDYQAPVLLHLNNHSTNATSYSWAISPSANASFSSTTDMNPTLNIHNPGTYTISLTATNDKESKTIEKQIIIKPDTNLLSFSNIKLGINTAHSSIGSFFSSSLGKVITKNEVNNSNGHLIDFVFFGLNDSFNYNQFSSPTNLQNTTFREIPNAKHTKIISTQELVEIQLNESQFNNINHGNDFRNITINESSKGNSVFNKNTTPRIILFQTQDGRKGAIKIKTFVSEGTQSYILTDIKVQKLP